MPIVKEKSAQLVKEKVPYEIISREVIQSLTNPSALAIYCYLISLPSNWTVRRQQILDHFDGLGRDRYDQAMRDLKQMGLVWIAETRNALGHVENRSIVVETIPKVGKPTIGENPQVGKATIGENPPLKDTDNKSLNIQIENKDTDSAFSEFWKHYPNKKGKAQAEKSFNRLSSNDKQLAIDDTFARAKSDPDWIKDDGKYIPMPATYLNGRRFEDEWKPARQSSRHEVFYV